MTKSSILFVFLGTFSLFHIHIEITNEHSLDMMSVDSLIHLIWLLILILPVCLWACFSTGTALEHHHEDGALVVAAAPTCPSKMFKRRRVPTNGCGPQAKQAFMAFITETLKEFPPSFHDCCNAHDVCYRTCFKKKKSCDKKFKRCLQSAANSFHDKDKQYYHGAAEVVSTAVVAGAGTAYQASQTKHCPCVGGTVDDPQSTRRSALNHLRTNLRAIGTGLVTTAKIAGAIVSKTERGRRLVRAVKEGSRRVAATGASMLFRGVNIATGAVQTAGNALNRKVADAKRKYIESVIKIKDAARRASTRVGDVFRHIKNDAKAKTDKAIGMLKQFTSRDGEDNDQTSRRSPTRCRQPVRTTRGRYAGAARRATLRIADAVRRGSVSRRSNRLSRRIAGKLRRGGKTASRRRSASSRSGKTLRGTRRTRTVIRRRSKKSVRQPRLSEKALKRCSKAKNGQALSKKQKRKCVRDLR